jgi:undecaprenyl-diphosphatase
VHEEEALADEEKKACRYISARFGHSDMSIFKILVLAMIQGGAELLPVSSSAHVIVAEKLMGLDPTSPEMTLLLVMLHTGTMFAVIFFFWKTWKKSFFASRKLFLDSAKFIIIATVFTAVAGLFLKFVIEKLFMKEVPHAEVENLFGNLVLISISLACVGILIMIAGWKARKRQGAKQVLDVKSSSWIGAVQGVCLPFRGFSRSGATISTGLLLGIDTAQAESFSFALAVVLTPPVIAREVWRLLKAQHVHSLTSSGTMGLFYPSLLGMVLSFVAGILALRWLSSSLERGRWHFFGIYCVCASLAVYLLQVAVFR